MADDDKNGGATTRDEYRRKYFELLASEEHRKLLAEERRISDERYASKLTEKIVYGGVGLVLVAVLTAIIALVVRGQS